MHYIGIDPDKGGAIALLNNTPGVVNIWSTPVIPKKEIKSKSGRGKTKSIPAQYKPVEMYLLFKQIVTSALLIDTEGISVMLESTVFGRGNVIPQAKGIGLWHGICIAMEAEYPERVQVKLISVSSWKTTLKLIGQPKEQGVVTAKELFPSLNQTNKLHRGTDRKGNPIESTGAADAVCIAYYNWLSHQKPEEIVEVPSDDPVDAATL